MARAWSKLRAIAASEVAAGSQLLVDSAGKAFILTPNRSGGIPVNVLRCLRLQGLFVLTLIPCRTECAGLTSYRLIVLRRSLSRDDWRKLSAWLCWLQRGPFLVNGLDVSGDETIY